MKRDWLFSGLSALRYLWRGQSNLYIHSPFVFEFCNQVRDAPPSPAALKVRDFFQHKSRESVAMEWDHPSGKRIHTSRRILIQRSSLPPAYGFLLNNLVRHYGVKRILELGTHLGVGTSYLCAGNQLDRCISLEGSAVLTEQARNHFLQQGLQSVEVVTGLFHETLPGVISEQKPFDLIFFDGHHDGEATWQYFLQCLASSHPKTVFVFDDIYWSRDMQAAWKKIVHHEAVRLSIDLYRLGIVFFRQEQLQPEHFCLRYGWHLA
jgi:predicted O-methyltransferase YrrM